MKLNTLLAAGSLAACIACNDIIIDSSNSEEYGSIIIPRECHEVLSFVYHESANLTCKDNTGEPIFFYSNGSNNWEKYKFVQQQIKAEKESK